MLGENRKLKDQTTYPVYTDNFVTMVILILHAMNKFESLKNLVFLTLYRIKQLQLFFQLWTA